MTDDERDLGLHQIGMYLAMREIDTPDGLARWRWHNRKASELRERVGLTFQPYSFANKPLIKATYNSLVDGLITHVDFAAILSNVRGEYLL